MNLLLPATVSPYSFGGWGLAFRVGEFGAAETSELEANTARCRSAVAELVGLLARHESVDLTLPHPRPIEIVIEEDLRWGQAEYKLVINTLDGVVSVSHPEREPLERLLSAIEDDLKVATDASR